MEPFYVVLPNLKSDDTIFVHDDLCNLIEVYTDSSEV